MSPGAGLPDLDALDRAQEGTDEDVVFLRTLESSGVKKEPAFDASGMATTSVLPFVQRFADELEGVARPVSPAGPDSGAEDPLDEFAEQDGVRKQKEPGVVPDRAPPTARKLKAKKADAKVTATKRRAHTKAGSPKPKKTRRDAVPHTSSFVESGETTGVQHSEPADAGAPVDAVDVISQSPGVSPIKSTSRDARGKYRSYKIP
jgi:hypothetical protein